MGLNAAYFSRSTSILGRLLLSVALTLDHIFEWMVVVFVAASLCAIAVCYYIKDVDNDNHPLSVSFFVPCGENSKFRTQLDEKRVTLG